MHASKNGPENQVFRWEDKSLEFFKLTLILLRVTDQGTTKTRVGDKLKPLRT